MRSGLQPQDRRHHWPDLIPIAFQTNILALNAAVAAPARASRAGLCGGGREVRSLAQRSAAAASDIKVLIQSSVTAVDGGVRHVEDAGTAMKDIVSSVQRVGDIIGESRRRLPSSLPVLVR